MHESSPPAISTRARTGKPNSATSWLKPMLFWRYCLQAPLIRVGYYRRLARRGRSKKLIVPVVTNRDVLKKLPVSLEGSRVLEFTDFDTPEKAEEFVQEFQDSLAASH